MADKENIFEDPFNTLIASEPEEFTDADLEAKIGTDAFPKLDQKLLDERIDTTFLYKPFLEDQPEVEYKPIKVPTYQQLKDAGVEDYEFPFLSDAEKRDKFLIDNLGRQILMPQPQATNFLSIEDTKERSFPKIESPPLLSPSTLGLDDWAEENDRDKDDKSSVIEWANYKRERGFTEGANLIDLERRLQQGAMEEFGDPFSLNTREEKLGSEFTQRYLDLELEEDLNPTQRQTLIDSAKIEAVDRGDYTFARVEVEDENGNIGSRIHLGNNSITNIEELKSEALRSLKDGLIDYSDLATIQETLNKTNVGDLKFNRAQLTQLNIELDAIAEDADSIGNAFLQRLLHYQLIPSSSKYKETGLTGGKGWVKPLKPETIQDAVQYNGLVQDALYRPVQKTLLVNDFKRRGRFEEANEIEQSKSLDWVSKYIIDESKHKYGLKNLRGSIYEQAISYVNSSNTFKFFSDVDLLHKNIRISPKGTILIHPQLNYDKNNFDVAVKNMKDSEGNPTDLSIDQVNELYDARNAFITNNYDELDRLLREAAPDDLPIKWAEHVAENDKKSPEETLSKVDLFDSFYADKDVNFESTLFDGIGASIESAFVNMYHGLAASVFGSEYSANALVKQAAEEADRQKYNRLWGEQLGLGYDISTMVAPVFVDIFAGGAVKKSIAGIGAVSKLSQAGMKPGLMNYSKMFVGYGLGARKGMSFEDLADAYVKQGTMDSVQVKNAVTESIKSYNTLLSNRLGIDVATFVPAANRSAAGMYSSVYSSLKAQNPNATHEELHAKSMFPALAGGAITGSIVLAMSRFGYGGLEKIFLENVPFKQAAGILRGIKAKGAGSKGFSDDTAKSFFKKLMEKEIRDVMKNNIAQGVGGTLKEAASEGFEEAIDTFVNTFVETWATGEPMTFGDRILAASHAFVLGSVMGGGGKAAKKGVQIAGQAAGLENFMSPDFSDPELYAEQAIRNVSEQLETQLKNTNSPLTASYINQILTTPVGEADTEPESIPKPRVLVVPEKDRDEHLSQLREAVKYQDLAEGPSGVQNLPEITDPALLELAKADTNYNISDAGLILGIKDQKNMEWVGFAPISTSVRQLDTDSNNLSTPVVDPRDLSLTKGVSVEIDRWSTENNSNLKSKSISIDVTTKTDGIADVDIGSSPKGLGQPVIRINREGLAKKLGEVPVEERFDLFNKILGEEVTHAAEIVQFMQDYNKKNKKNPTEKELKDYVTNRHKDMYKDMAVQERKNVVAAYLNISQEDVVLPEEASPERPASMTEQSIAAEFIRMLVQYEKTKQTTESSQWLTSKEVATFMGGVFDRIKKGFLSSKRGFTGPVAQELRKHLDNIKDILVDFSTKELAQVPKEEITKAIDENDVIQRIEHNGKEWEFLEEPGTSVKNASWNNRGKKRDGSALLHRDKKVKLVKRIDTTSSKTIGDQRKDTFELVDIETGEVIGTYSNQIEAVNGYREIQNQESTIEDEIENVEPPQDPTINNETDQEYVDLVDSQVTNEKTEEIQEMVFEATLTPRQMQAIKDHAEAVASGKQDKVNSARAEVISSGLGTGPLDDISAIANPKEAMAKVMESFGLDPSPIVEDASGTLKTLSERFPTSEQIISLNPEKAGTINRDEELRVVELIKKTMGVAQQWGIETRQIVDPPINRGAMWVDKDIIYVDADQLSIETEAMSEETVADYVEALAFAQVAIVQSYETHSQKEITDLIDETSDVELAELISQMYSKNAREDALKRASGEAEGGELTAAQELTSLMRYKMSRDATRIVNGQSAADIDAYVNQKPTFKSLFVSYLNRLTRKFSYNKRLKKDNPAYSIMVNNLIERLRAYKGGRRDPYVPFDVRKPFATIEMAQDLIAGQAAEVSEDQIPTSQSKNARISLANVANSQSYHNDLAQDLIDNNKGKTLDKDLNLPDVSSPAEILVAFFEADLQSYGNVFTPLDQNLLGSDLYVAMKDRYDYLKESDADRPAIGLVKAYLDFVDPPKASLAKESPNSFSGYISRMLKDPSTRREFNSQGETVNNATSFVVAATRAINENQKGEFRQDDLLGVLESTDTDFVPSQASVGRVQSNKIPDNFTNKDLFTYQRVADFDNFNYSRVGESESEYPSIAAINGSGIYFLASNEGPTRTARSILRTYEDRGNLYNFKIKEENETDFYQIGKRSPELKNKLDKLAQKLSYLEPEDGSEGVLKKVPYKNWSDLTEKGKTFWPYRQGAGNDFIGAINTRIAEPVDYNGELRAGMTVLPDEVLNVAGIPEYANVGSGKANISRNLTRLLLSSVGIKGVYEGLPNSMREVVVFDPSVLESGDGAVGSDFVPSQASSAKTTKSNINSSRVVELVELPVFEAGTYNAPGFVSSLFKGRLDPRLRRIVELRRTYQKYLGTEITEYKRVLDEIIEKDFGSRSYAPLAYMARAVGSTKGIVIPQEKRDQIEKEYDAAEKKIVNLDTPSEVKESLYAKIDAERTAKFNKEEQIQREQIQEEIKTAKEYLEEVSPRLLKHLEAMRERVDVLSKEIMGYLGGNEDLKMHFDNQLGLYLTRSYRIHSEEGWVDTIMNDPNYEKEKQAALKYFEDEFVGTYAKDLLQAERKEWMGLTKEEQQKEAEKMAKEALAGNANLPTEILKSFLLDRTSNLDATGNSKIVNSDPIDSFRRKLSDAELPPELRAVMGEYGEDTADFNLMRTFLNVGNIASQQAFLHGIVALGRSGTKEQRWLLTREEVKERGLEGKYVAVRDPDKTPDRKNIKGASRFDPLLDFVDSDGKYKGPLFAPERMVEDFRQEFSNRNKFDQPYLERIRAVLDGTFRFLTGLSLGAVTLGSIPFYIRNITSNLLFFGPSQGLLPFKGSGSAFKEMVRELNLIDKSYDSERKLLTKIGVLGDEFTSNMFRDLLEGNISERTIMRDFNAELNKLSVPAKRQSTQVEGGLIKRSAKKVGGTIVKGKEITEEQVLKVTKKLRDLSVAADAFYKITLFRHEYKTLKKAQDYAVKHNLTDELGLKDKTVWTDDKLKEEAGRKVLDTAQSYSQRFPITKAIQQSAVGVLAAPFLGFKLEIPRIIANTYKVARKDVRSKNPVLRRRGRARQAGMTTNIALSSGGRVFGYSKLIGMVWEKIWGEEAPDDEEDDALRAGASAWGKHFSYQYIRTGDGLLKMHQTYINPYAMYGDGVARFVESTLDGDMSGGVWKAFESTIGSPFLDGQIFISGLQKAVYNKGEYGPISYATNPLENARDRFAFLFNEAFMPPTIKNLFPFGEKMKAALENKRDVQYTVEDINEIFSNPEGLVFAQGLPTKVENVDYAEYADRHYRTAFKIKRNADSQIRDISFDRKLSADIIKKKISNYQNLYLEAVEETLKYQNTYIDKWGLGKEYVNDKISTILGKEGFRTYSDYGYILLPDISDSKKDQLSASEFPDVQERRKLIDDEMSKRDKIYIRPDSKGRLKASYTPPPE